MNARIPAAAFAAALWLMPAVAPAGDAAPFSAREGEGLARSAAAAWASDAQLVYVENDELLADSGRAERWGYLFWSDAREEARAYSVRDGEIRTATGIGFDFPAPPLPDGWIDSGRALAVADEDEGDDYRAKHAGRLRAMFLVRGLLDPEKPGSTAWAIVYESDSASGLWVVVDATSGKVVNTWRG